MRYLESFKVFESGKQSINIEDIKYSLVELIDRGFEIKIIPFYMNSNGRHLEFIENGFDISISNANLFKIDDIIDVLDSTKEYIYEKYNMKLDFISKNLQYDYMQYMQYKSFDEIKNDYLRNIRITFKPIGFLTKAKNYIKNKFK